MARKFLTKEKFEIRAAEAHEGKYGYSLFNEIKNSKTKIPIDCPVHGEFWQQPSVHMRGQGCPKCYKDKLSQIRFDKQETKKNKKKLPRKSPFRNKTPEEMLVIQAKKRHTCLERYGVENPSQSGKVKSKKANTLYDNYGVDNPMHSDVIKEKVKNTNIARFGVENPMQSDVVKNRLSKIMINKYGAPTFAQSHISKECLEIIQNQEKLEEFIRDKAIIPAAQELGISQPCLSQYLIRHGLNEPGRSTYERELRAIFENWGLDFIPNDRTILYPKELDFFFPKYNIAIEFCGLYFHSQTALETRNQSGRKYHLDKLMGCKKQGIQLITIFEDELLNRKETVVRRLKYMFGLAEAGPSARQCEIKIINEVESKDFMEKYHVQGNSSGAYVRLGAFYNDDCIGVMTFSKPRIALGNKATDSSYELLRFATDGNKHAGLASRLFSHFIRNYNVSTIISYADRRWSTGNLYYQLGFDLTNTNEPSYWYIDQRSTKRFHRFKFRKQVVVEKMGGDPELSEWKNMRNMGHDRIWDCGTLRFEWKL